AGLWVAQRGIQVLLDRKARASDDPKTMVGINAGSMIGRGWLVALTIFAVGLADSEAGLAAAVLVLALFTVHFSTSMILGPLDKTSVSSP
ncbi:MAG: hypothetical protein H0T15_09690, partial [Thermoleophilaceae bacterium]|nr:hypothetical protein [Thermoleophilaceae bacterium]